MLLFVESLFSIEVFADIRLPRTAEIKVVTKVKYKSTSGWASGQPVKGYGLVKGDEISLQIGKGRKVRKTAKFSFPLYKLPITVPVEIPLGKGNIEGVGGINKKIHNRKGHFKLYIKKKVMKVVAKKAYYRYSKKDKWRKWPYGWATEKKVTLHEIDVVVKKRCGKNKKGKWIWKLAKGQ